MKVEAEIRTVPHLKAQMHIKLVTLKAKPWWHFFLKKGNLLHKWGLDDSQSHTTVSKFKCSNFDLS